MATDPNSSVVSVPGTPLKAIDNICSSVVAGSLDDSGHGPSISGSDQPMFVRPQQTSTPAARRPSPSDVVPSSIVGFLVPIKRCAVDGAVRSASCFSQDGGFLPESQPVSLTPVIPGRKNMRRDVVDLTADEDADAASVSQFKPTTVSTQITPKPVTIGNHVSDVFPRIGNFDNSFATDELSMNKFKPVAMSTQISPKAVTAGSAGELHSVSGNFEKCFADKTLMNEMQESGSPMKADAGTATALEYGSTIAQDKGRLVFKPSQELQSRSPSPELFDGDDGVTQKVEVPSSTIVSSSTTQSHPAEHVAVSDDNKAALSLIHI